MRKQVYMFIFCLLSISKPIVLVATNLKVSDKNIHASPELGKVKLFHGKDGFKVWREGRMERIPCENLSSELRSINKKTLKEYQKNAYIKLGRNSDGQVTASSHVRGNAGGPILGETLYWSVKAGCYWAIGVASQAIIDNVKGVKSGNTFIVPPGEDPLNTAIDKGGLPGTAALAIKTVATKGPLIIAGHSLKGAASYGKHLMTGPAWDNINSIGTGTGGLVGYHAPSYQSPFMASLVTKTPVVTPARMATWSGSAAAGHYVYKEGMMGSAGRAQWDTGFKMASTSARSTLSDGALTGATLGIGAASTQGAAAAVGGIEMLAQAARAWGYAQPCP